MQHFTFTLSLVNKGERNKKKIVTHLLKVGVLFLILGEN